MNSISGEEVSLTGNKPYLTRDAVEITIERKKLNFKIIDTAGFSKDLNGNKNLNKDFIYQTKKKNKIDSNDFDSYGH